MSLIVLLQGRLFPRASTLLVRRCTLHSTATTTSPTWNTPRTHHGRIWTTAALAAAAASVAAAAASSAVDENPPLGSVLSSRVTLLDSGAASAAAIGGDVKEAATGILFPPLCNGYTLMGTGVRVKYGLIKVYAVGTYMDVAATATANSNNNTSSNAALQLLLLDPTIPRTIRIVMNRTLSVQAYTEAIVAAVTPRMQGQDLAAVTAFQQLNPPTMDLVAGSVMEMTIRGDTCLYKNAAGGLGSIHSAAFCRALLDVYYGDDPVSPTHKASVVQGLQQQQQKQQL